MKKFSFFIIILLAFTSCELLQVNPLEDTQILISPDYINTTINIVFEDANTNEPIGLDNATQVDVTILGKDKEEVLSLFGQKGSSYEADGGFLSLAINPATEISLENPLEFRVIAEADGYISNSVNIVVYDEQHQEYHVKLVNLDDTPEGVENVTDNTVVASNGVVSEELTLQTPATNRGLKAEVVIPKDMVMKDKDGNLLSGAIKTEVTYFSPVDNSSLDAYPGGLSANVDTDGDGVEEYIDFTSAGFITIEMTDDNGRQAATFEQGALDVTMDIPADLVNPETGSAVEDGDVVPLWSYEEETGKWTAEGTVIIEETSPGVFESKLQLTHLSSYNIDWFTTGGPQCINGANFTVTSSDDSYVGGAFLTFEFFTPDDLRRKTKSWYVPLDQVHNFYLPPLLPATVRIYDAATRVLVYDSGIALDLCNGNYVFDISRPTPCTGGKGTTTVDISGICPANPNIAVFPSFPFWYINLAEPGAVWTSAYMQNGQYTFQNICLSTPQRYRFRFIAEGQPHEFETEMSSPNILVQGIPFPSEICETLFD